MCARKSFVRAHERTQKSARQIRRRVGVISRAGRWLRKLVVSHENGYIQAGNDPTASHLLLTISVCTKIVCNNSCTHAQICSTNNDQSCRYFSSCSRNKNSTTSYLSSSSGNKNSTTSYLSSSSGNKNSTTSYLSSSSGNKNSTTSYLSSSSGNKNSTTSYLSSSSVNSLSLFWMY